MKYYLLLITLFAFFHVQAQNRRMEQPSDSSKTFYSFTLRGGQIVTGTILEETDTTYRVQTRKSGKLTLSREQVVSVRPVGEDEEMEDGYGYYTNKFTHKLLFMPTAISPERGKLYYSNTYLFFSGFTYGISEHWSVGANTIFYQPYGVYVKATINPKSRTRLAVQAQYFFGQNVDISGNTTWTGAGYIQAMLTKGTARNNFTLGIGGGISRGGVGELGVLTLGGTKKVSPKLSFVTQNHLLLGWFTDQVQLGLLMPALRLDRHMHAFDVGLMIPFVHVSSSTASKNTWAVLLPYAGVNVKIN